MTANRSGVIGYAPTGQPVYATPRQRPGVGSDRIKHVGSLAVWFDEHWFYTVDPNRTVAGFAFAPVEFNGGTGII